MKMTVNQLADILGVEYAIASSFIKLLELRGLATAVGKQKPKNTTGRGKPSTIFDIPKSVEIKIHDLDEVVAEAVLTVVAPAPAPVLSPVVNDTDFEPVIVTEQMPATDETLVYSDC